jgi:hypothetical protein
VRRTTSRAAGKVENTVQRTRTTADAAVSTSTQAAAEAAAESKARSESAAHSSTSVLDVDGAADAASSVDVQSDVQRPRDGGPKASVMGDAALDASVDARHEQTGEPAKGNTVSASASGEQRASAAARSNRNEP